LILTLLKHFRMPKLSIRLCVDCSSLPGRVHNPQLEQRVICHCWYHTGENMAIRQLLGHGRLPVFVGNIDDKAPYRPE